MEHFTAEGLKLGGMLMMPLWISRSARLMIEDSSSKFLRSFYYRDDLRESIYFLNCYWPVFSVFLTISRDLADSMLSLSFYLSISILFRLVFACYLSNPIYYLTLLTLYNIYACAV